MLGLMQSQPLLISGLSEFAERTMATLKSFRAGLRATFIVIPIKIQPSARGRSPTRLMV